MHIQSVNVALLLLNSLESDNISETALDRDVVIGSDTRKQPNNSSNCYDID